MKGTTYISTDDELQAELEKAFEHWYNNYSGKIGYGEEVIYQSLKDSVQSFFNNGIKIVNWE